MAVTDSTIGNLPAANLLENADMFAIEQGGEAKKLTGLKLKDFIQGAGEIFVATRTTYYTDVEAALAGGKFVVYVDNNNRVYIHQEKRGNTHFFVGVGVGNTPPNLNATYTYATLTSPRMWVESFTKDLQALLTWDATPTANSNNPVRSGGIKTYVDDAIAAIPEIEVDDALSDTSENPVQNKVITDAIYNSLATDSASGDIVSFPDGADNVPLKSLVASITPLQDLHGQANPYPAKGMGNYFDEDTLYASFKTGNNAFSGTASAINMVQFNIPQELVGQELTFSVHISSYAATSVRAYATAGGTGVNGNTGTAPFWSSVTFTPTSTSDKVQITYGSSGAGITVFDSVQLEVGSSRTTWRPYSNICPISGWTGAKINVTGINIWDESNLENGALDGAGNNVRNGDANYRRSANYFPVVGGLSYYCVSSVAGFIYFYDKDKNFISRTTLGALVFSAPSNAFYLRFWCNASGYTPISINYPATDTSYHAYNGSQIDVSWSDEAGTVYGGTLNVTTGLLTSNRGTINFSTVTITKHGSLPNAFTISGIPSGGLTPLSNLLPYLNTFPQDEYGMYLYSNVLYLGVPSSVASTVATFRQWAIDNGLEVIYGVSTPQTYQLTPTEVKTLLGDNNIFCDTGDVDVTYRADTALYIEKKLGA